jgi:hypothetical protein
MGTRPVGRLRQRWKEDVMEDLNKLKVKNWKEASKGRRTWRDLAEKAKTHKGLWCQMMLMICWTQGERIVTLHYAEFLGPAANALQ